jgi:antitoxin ParD1/3/4
VRIVSKNTSVSLGGHFAEFIGEQVARGRFSSASDVVRAGLRLLEEREARLLALQAALVEGERSGEPEPRTSIIFLRTRGTPQSAGDEAARVYAEDPTRRR